MTSDYRGATDSNRNDSSIMNSEIFFVFPHPRRTGSRSARRSASWWIINEISGRVTVFRFVFHSFCYFTGKTRAALFYELSFDLLSLCLFPSAGSRSSRRLLDSPLFPQWSFPHSSSPMLKSFFNQWSRVCVCLRSAFLFGLVRLSPESSALELLGWGALSICSELLKMAEKIFAKKVKKIHTKNESLGGSLVCAEDQTIQNL